MIPSSTIVLTAATHQDLDELPEKELWIGLKSIIQVKTYRYVFKNGYLILNKPRIPKIAVVRWGYF
jgi:hypothetical protein